ncbi:MAG: hypothetical protein KY437_07560 [Actinobacteria bacterium]|nr:hypothetical protein [Actinomycetota bacterium]
MTLDDLIRPAPVRWTWPRVLGAAGAGIATTLVTLLVRPAGAPLLDTVWAEDGSEFLANALVLDPLASLFEPYSGYLHVVPHLVAEIATALRVSAAAEVLAVAAAIVTTSCALIVFHAAAGHVPSPWVRGALAGLVALVPLSGWEAIGNVANVHWYLTFTAFWVLLWRPTSWAGTTLSAVLLASTALTAPQSVLLAPLALARFGRPRDPRTVIPSGAYVLAIGAQLAVIASVVDAGTGLVGAPAETIAHAYGQRVLATVVAGHQLSARVWDLAGWAWPVAAGVSVAALLAYGFTRVGWPRRAVALLACAYSGVFLVSAVYWRGTAQALVWPPGAANGAADRYQIIPVLLLWSALAVVLGSHRDPDFRLFDRLLPALTVGAATVMVVSSLRVTTPRDGPSWDAGVERGRTVCAHRSLNRYEVEIDPGGWAAPIPCDRLSGV